MLGVGGGSKRLMASTTAMPRLVAFDLDATLWLPEMYELPWGAPFQRDASGCVRDAGGTRVSLMGATPQVLRELATDPKWRGTRVAYVSRTEHPDWALDCMRAFVVADGVTMLDVSHHREIYPGCKIKHFKKIQKESGIGGCDQDWAERRPGTGMRAGKGSYEDMVFYDNEYGNIRDCSSLGITCMYTPDGLTSEAWIEGLRKYATRAADAR